MIGRRAFVASGLAAAAAGPFKSSWSSLEQGYRAPEWFARAKFGIWAHWSAQCVPEFGDWYGRLMYVQGDPFYDHHLKTYGHPSRTGFMEIENLWKAENWQPDALIQLYKSAGARYFMALACHHDNLDTFNSRHHPWNTLRVGPRRDIIGGWAKAARAAGLRFGVSNHAAHSWHWYQVAYGYDAEGPLAGKRYDAYWLRKEQGRGKWWEGLDPQALYNGPYDVPPDGITSIAAMNAWHAARDGQWVETVPPGARGVAYAQRWLLRQNDLVDQYRPDMVYMDDTGLPLGPYGLQAAAHYYNQATGWHGRPDVVITGKKLDEPETHGIVEDVERGFSDHLRPLPWQTDTCIGNWHYDRALYERHGYKTAEQVVQRLADVVSKNGNLMLSIPMKPDGTHDPDEYAILADLGRWFRTNGAAIYDSTPWRRFGEGPTRTIAGMQNEQATAAFTPEDIRFTVGPPEAGGSRPLFALMLGWPAARTTIRSLGLTAGRVERVSLLGSGPIDFSQDPGGLTFILPPAPPGSFVPAVRIEGHGIA